MSAASPHDHVTVADEGAAAAERAALRARMEAAFEGFDGNLLAANIGKKHDSPT